MDAESPLVEVVSVATDPVTDGLIDAMNAKLSDGQWEQVAVLVEDIRSIALDAVGHPSGDDGVIRGGGAGGRD